jgi:putative redox protein
MGMSSFFISAKNDERIKVWLQSPTEPSDTLLVLCHGFTGDSSGLAAALADHLSEKYTICRFDFRGQGESDGEFASTTISRELEDLGVVISYLQKKYSSSRLVVAGHSFGAAIALLYSQQHHVDGLISLSGEGDLKKAVSLEFNTEQLEDFQTRGDALVENWSKNGRLDSLKVDFLNDMQEHSTTAAIQALHTPVLFLHGDVDEVIPLSQTQELYALANKPKELVVLKGMDHSYGFYGNIDSSKAVADYMSRWLEKIQNNSKY